MKPFGVRTLNTILLLMTSFTSAPMCIPRLLYRTIRNLKDHRGGYNNYIRLSELADMPYEELLRRMGALRKADVLPWAA